MDGGMDWNDASQDYLNNPDAWSTGLLVDDVRVYQNECGTCIALGGAASTVSDSQIYTAGDHVHEPGCTPTEADEGLGDWSDGITFSGPGHTITGNLIVDPSDVGIVFFGGKNTVISNNEVKNSAGNYGSFAGIAVHPWIFGDVSGVQVSDNLVSSLADTQCGGMHVGINIGTHMWSAGCVGSAHSSTVGNPGICTLDPPQPMGTLCTEGALCQVWAHVAAGQTFTLQDNFVTGAQINYLIEGLDLVGTLIENGNIGERPRLTDWAASKNGCTWNGVTDTWGTINKAAKHPTLTGWTEQRVHCER
jgi:hypothetical protein